MLGQGLKRKLTASASVKCSQGPIVNVMLL